MAARRFRDLPIRRKLTLVYLATSGLALLLASLAFLAFEVISFRQDLVHNTSTEADIIGYNSASALLFNDRAAAEQTLEGLRANPHIVAAGIYRPDGSRFAAYVRDTRAPAEVLAESVAPADRDGHQFLRDALVVFQDIVVDGERIGSVRLLSDLAELRQLLLRYGGIVLIVFLVSLAAALPVLSRLQQVISEPIMDLVEKAKIVSTEKDYAVRATRSSTDELGLLVDTFNEMLGQIQGRDTALEHARHTAETANRAKDEFLAVVSHELRTPLTPILAWARMLRSGQLDPAATRAAEIIERNAKSQAQLIEDLLDVSRIITGKLRLDVRQVEIAPVIESAIDSVRPTAELKAVRLRTVIDPRAGAVSGDPERLTQIIWNLLSNAVKFTPKGGQVQVLLQRINSHVEITVSDTGQGIASEFLPYVFDRFRQADSSTTRAHGGLGLGLAIVRHLVELHGGRIRVESPGEGKGSTFMVELPISPLAPAPGERPHPTADTSRTPPTLATLAGLRVLAVDDDADTLETIRVLLEQQGAVVRTALSVHDAIVLLDEAPPDVIISDIGMPHEDGYEFIRSVRARTPAAGGRVPALALTAYARVEDRLQVLSAGFQMHVPKPIEPAELIAVVASMAEWAARTDKRGA